MVEYGGWAGGAFAIGIGILPASRYSPSWRSPGPERARPGVRAFVAVTAGAVVELRLVCGDQGRLPVDRVLEPGRRAEPRLSRAACVRRDRVAARARGGAGLGRARRCRGGPRAGRLRARRPGTGELPVLRGPRPLDPRAREPRVVLAGGQDRGRARRRHAPRDDAPLVRRDVASARVPRARASRDDRRCWCSAGA